MESACTRFRTHNAVQSAFKRRNISSGREITLNFLQNRRIIVNYVCLDLFRRWKRRTLRPARITQCKVRLNVAVFRTGDKHRIIFRQKRRMNAFCLYLGLFLRLTSRALRSASIMQWTERLNVELSQTGEKYRIIFFAIDKWFRLASFCACFYDGKRVHYVLHA